MSASLKILGFRAFPFFGASSFRNRWENSSGCLSGYKIKREKAELRGLVAASTVAPIRNDFRQSDHVFYSPALFIIPSKKIYAILWALRCGFAACNGLSIITLPYSF